MTVSACKTTASFAKQELSPALSPVLNPKRHKELAVAQIWEFLTSYSLAEVHIKKKKCSFLCKYDSSPFLGVWLIDFLCFALIWTMEAENLRGINPPKCENFQYRTLAVDTNNFDEGNKLGGGGFGYVYQVRSSSDFTHF